MFGDQKTTLKIEEAATLDVRFEDPEDPHRVLHQKHVFKVTPLGVKPLERDTPVVLGLVTTCCHYLDLMVRSIRHNHVRMREGLPTTDTLEAETKRLNIIQTYDTLVDGESEGEVSGQDVVDDMLNKVSHGDVLPEVKEELTMFCRACSVKDNPVLRSHDDVIYDERRNYSTT
jgi:hypothetical protein